MSSGNWAVEWVRSFPDLKARLDKNSHTCVILCKYTYKYFLIVEIETKEVLCETNDFRKMHAWLEENGYKFDKIFQLVVDHMNYEEIDEWVK